MEFLNLPMACKLHSFGVEDLLGMFSIHFGGWQVNSQIFVCYVRKTIGARLFANFQLQLKPVLCRRGTFLGAMIVQCCKVEERTTLC